MKWIQWKINDDYPKANTKQPDTFTNKTTH